MERHLISVGTSTPLLDVHRLFVEEEIHGAPVVDEEGSAVGVITSTDLLRAVEEEHDTMRVQTDYFRELLPYSSPDWSAAGEDFQDRLSELRAEDAMARRVLTVSPQTPVPDVARMLRENGIHRVFVSEGGRLLGVISAFDLLRLVEDWKVS
jgi:CBS domain-containing protein